MRHWDEMIFVFGSNLAGKHGAGAALDAKRFWGAENGIGEGLTGNAYAIPTKDVSLKTLPLNAIQEHVERFISFARAHPEMRFMVTRIGCGLAGYADEQIAPLFQGVPDNVLLPAIWRNNSRPKVIVAGSRVFEDYDLMEQKLDHLLMRLENPIIISGAAKGADTLGVRYAESRGLEHEVFPAKWKKHGKGAGFLRNKIMAWAGTHLVAFPVGKSPGTRHMIAYARENRLKVRVVE